MDGRVTVATLDGFSVGLVISKVFLLGSVLLPILWCWVVDDLLTKVSGIGEFVQRYADDMFFHGG